MSNMTKNINQECIVLQACDAIELIIQPRDKDLGGFSVRRALPNSQRQMVGPWIFFDHMGPANFPAGQGINVRPHPHINIATVTYLFEGEILHRDSLGSVQVIKPGDINLMVTGRGMTHSEREHPEITAVAHNLHGLQLWLALPEKDEEIDPVFYHYPSASIPALTIDGVALRVLIGSAFGVSSPVKMYAETLYVEAHLHAGQKIVLPLAQERAMYVAKGHMQVQNTQIPEHAMAVFIPDKNIVLQAIQDSRIAIIGGEKLSKRYIEWNFVSSRAARIEQAKQDWKDGKFPKVIDDEEEFIPLPE